MSQVLTSFIDSAPHGLYLRIYNGVELNRLLAYPWGLGVGGRRHRGAAGVFLPHDVAL